MKRFFITMGIVVTMTVAVQAQSVKFGVRTGLNLSTLIADVEAQETEKSYVVGSFKTGIQAGFHAGVFVEFPITEKIFFEAGLAYSAQGAKFKSFSGIALLEGTYVENIGQDYTNSYMKVNVVSLPIWIKYDFQGFRPKLGVNLGQVVGMETKLLYENKEIINKSKAKRGFDFGLGIGAEYNLPIGLFFDATFNLGLANLTQKNIPNYSDSNFENIKLKNQTFQIGVGYKF